MCQEATAGRRARNVDFGDESDTSRGGCVCLAHGWLVLTPEVTQARKDDPAYRARGALSTLWV